MHCALMNKVCVKKLNNKNNHETCIPCPYFQGFYSHNIRNVNAGVLKINTCEENNIHLMNTGQG